MCALGSASPPAVPGMGPPGELATIGREPVAGLDRAKRRGVTGDDLGRPTCPPSCTHGLVADHPQIERLLFAPPR